MFPKPDAIFSGRLAPDTVTLDLKLTDRNNLPADVDEVYDPPNSGIVLFVQDCNIYTNFTGIPGIRIRLPRTHSQSEIIKAPSFIKATELTPHKQLPTMEHLIPVPKADSVIMIEITPTNTNHNLNMFLSFEKIPTFRSFMFTTKISALPKNESEGIYRFTMIWHLLLI